MKKNLKRTPSPSLSPNLSVVFSVSNFSANSDEEVSTPKAWTQRVGLVSRSLTRLGGGFVALMACGHARDLPYGEGLWRKQMMALSLENGIVGGARDLIRAFSQHPGRASEFGSFAMSRLAQDLREEALALPREKL